MKTAFVDTHCHFDFPPFRNHEEESLQLAVRSGVERLVVPAVTRDRFDDIARLTARFSSVYGALGLHPLYIDSHKDSDIAELAHRLMKKDKRIVAVGEIGLDDYMETPQVERQEQLLIEQLRLAERFDLPVILHSRRTHDRLAKLLREAKLSRMGVIHGFSGSLSQAQAFIKLGYFIGVGGVITYERAQKTRRAIAKLPLERLLLETDAPDMPPAGFQGQPNRPEQIAYTFEQLCQLRDEPPEQIAHQIYLNSLALFWPCQR